MKKLTAGIFAGILTIVTVNAADAAIATSGYVTEKVGAVEEKVGILGYLETTNKESTVDAINEVVGKVKTNAENIETNTTSISNLKTAVDNLGGGENGSVAEQIASELGKINVTKPADAKGVATSVTQDNGTISVTYDQIADADVADDAAIAQSKIAGLVGDLGAKAAKTDLETTNANVTANKNAIDVLNGDENVAGSVKKALADAKAYADTAESGAIAASKEYADGLNTAMDTRVTEAEGKITTNTNDIAGINTKIGTVADGKTVVGLIEEAKQAAGTDLSGKLGELGEGNNTVADALAKKQNLLDDKNVKLAEDSTGNVVTAVTAENGTVTVTKGINAVTVPESTTPSEAGDYVLTATVDTNGTPTYYWERIDRVDQPK